MASGFFAVLDDIAVLMDDVAMMSKVAAKKTAGILGDDLAVNAEKASGFASSREMPVLWAIAKGSLINKVIILPIAFLLSAYLPIAVTIILVLGGIYLAYEGGEKIIHMLWPHDKQSNKPTIVSASETEILALEKSRIKSAIVTDFILSVEIVIIALGTVLEEPLTTQILVVSLIALVATVGVYGIVALIVRMDEFGAKLVAMNNEDYSFSDKLGRLLIQALPLMIRALGIIGTLALLLVAGGIFTHNISFLHEFLSFMPALIQEFSIGLIVGLVAAGATFGVQYLLAQGSKDPSEQ